MRARLSGHDAIEAAAARGLTLSAQIDPGSAEVREGVGVEEAREIARSAPGLIWLDLESRVYTALWKNDVCGEPVSDTKHVLLCSAATRWLTQHEDESLSITVLPTPSGDVEGLRLGNRSGALAGPEVEHEAARELVRRAREYVVAQCAEITRSTAQPQDDHEEEPEDDTETGEAKGVLRAGGWR